MIERNVTLRLGDNVAPARIPISQFDTMWRFIFNILYNSQAWTIPAGATAVLNGRKQDGNVFAISGAIADNKVTVDCDVQMTAVAGPVVCELSIMSGGKVVGTTNFILEVEPAPKAPDDVSSESTLPAYGEILDGIAELTAVPPGGTTGQVLKKASSTDYDMEWGSASGSSVSPYTSNPAALGTASPGSSDNYARGDHVHPKPSAADLGITVPVAASSAPEDLASSAAVGASTKYAREDHKHKKPSASDIGAIAAPSNPTSGQFLVYNGSAWVAQSLPTWQGGNY
jgi:hypothetical protein